MNRDLSALFGSRDGLDYDDNICQACGSHVEPHPDYRAVHAAWHLRLVALEWHNKETR